MGDTGHARHVALIAPPFESVPPRLYGGTERVVYNLCEGFTRLGLEVTLFASGDSHAPGKLVPVAEEALRLRGSQNDDPWAYTIRMIADVARRAHDFDIIHNHHDFGMLPLWFASPTPVINTLHGRLDLPNVPVAFQNYADMPYISISNAQRKPMPQLNWIATVLHGIDARSFSFYERPGNYLAFLGRLDHEKRPDLAIEMARRSGIPLKIAAKIATEGKERDFYETHVKKKIDGKFIEYIGEIAEHEKSEFLGNALALAFPIDWPEPFGLVMIEALATGTPVLARPCGSVPEVLRDGVTGFIHTDIEVLSRRALDIASHISRRDCRTWVEERFSIERMCHDYLNAYEQVLRESNVINARQRWGPYPHLGRSA